MDTHVRNDYWNPINWDDEVKTCKECQSDIKTIEGEDRCEQCDICKDCNELINECDCTLDKIIIISDGGDEQSGCELKKYI